MKIVIIKSNLKDGLSVVEKSAGEHANLPILKTTLLEAAYNKIKLTTTNLEVAISYFVLGKIIEDGKVAVPIRAFVDLIQNLQSERLNLDQKQHNLAVQTDNYEATLQGQSVDDFPIIPKVQNTESYLEIEGRVFREALSQVLLAGQEMESRQELSNILFDFSLDKLTLTATDSFRLAEKSIPSTQFTVENPERIKVLVPIKTSQELLRILKEGEMVRIYQDASQILFKTENFEFISRLSEGSFPEYQAIVPKKFDAEVVLNRQEFGNALKLAGIFAGKSSEIKIKIGENKKSLEVYSTDEALGENRYVLPAKVQGHVKPVVFNWRYLADGLKALRAEEVFFGMNEDNKPALLKSHNEGSYFYIIMPILNS